MIHYQDDTITLHHGDCVAVLRTLADNSIDAIVTDPPYGLEFMGKEWDGSDGFRRSLNANDTGRDNAFGRTSRTSPEYRAGHLFQLWCQQWATECLRVLKPGGHLLAFGGTRTWHRLAVAVEDAGFEIRDSIAWLYGSGFPKSLNVAKAIASATVPSLALSDDEARFCRWIRDESGLSAEDCRRLFGSARFHSGQVEVVNTATADAPRMGRRAMVPTHAAWLSAGLQNVPHWVAALVKIPPKPPMQTPSEWKAGKGEGTAGEGEWQGWGTALKPAFEPVVMARKPFAKGHTVAANVMAHGTGAINVDGCRIGDEVLPPQTAGQATIGTFERGVMMTPERTGRWPANVALDTDMAAVLDAQSGTLTSNGGKGPHRIQSTSALNDNRVAYGDYKPTDSAVYGDTGGASRFFFVAKAPSSERPNVDGEAHATVKPLDLMRWLIRLVTQPGGVVLDPFAGSGTTLEAAGIEGFRAVGIEREADYLPLIVQRIQRTPLALFDDGEAS